MSTNIRISDDLIHEAEVYAKAFNRSVPKQIEFWSRIGRTAEANPDLTYEDIKEILLALEEQRLGHVVDFKFSS